MPENINPVAKPQVFYIKDQFGFVIEMQYLCDYPVGKGAYGVYLNKRTGDPTRVYIKNLKPIQLDKKAMIEDSINDLKERIAFLESELETLLIV